MSTARSASHARQSADVDSRPGQAVRIRRLGAAVFVLALAVYGATTGGSMATDILSYEVTKGIVEHGTVAMSGNIWQSDAHRGVDGRYYAPYGIGHAIFSVPFYAAARFVERSSGLSFGKSEVLPKAGFVVGSAVATALAVWVAFLFAFALSNDARAAVGTALAVGFGTFLWPYAKFGFNAPLGALCVLLGTYGVWVGTRKNRPWMLWLGGAGLGGALLVKHEVALVCLPIGLWIIYESRHDWRVILKRGLMSGTPVVMALLATLYYNVVRFGNPLDTGYLRDDSVIVGSFWDGVIGLLFSAGDSVFMYAPIALVGVAALVVFRRRDPSTALLLLGEFGILVFFYSWFTHWDGERSYGPRYLLPVTPLLVLPIYHWLTPDISKVGRRVAAGLIVASALTQVPGVLVDFTKVGFTADAPFTWDERRWTWNASALHLNAKASLTAVPTNIRYLTGIEPKPVARAAQGEARDFSEQYGFSLDFWWVYLYYFGAISGRTAIAFGALCAVLIAALGWQVRRETVAAARPGAPLLT